MHIATSLKPLVLGESIAVMGVCLTVDAIAQDGFEADASTETLARTTLGALPIGHHVHLERALPIGGRLGGHIVAGHVDGVVQLLESQAQGASTRLTFALDPSLRAFVAAKGSVAIDGVSLTVNAVQGARFEVMIVPHTREATLLTRMPVGAKANVEVDVLARYVGRWLEVSREEHANGDQALLAKLASSGFL